MTTSKTKRRTKRPLQRVVMPPGTKVWAETISGEPIICTVRGREFGGYLLESPAHGYVILRQRSEIKPVEAA